MRLDTPLQIDEFLVQEVRIFSQVVQAKVSFGFRENGEFVRVFEIVFDIPPTVLLKPVKEALLLDALIKEIESFVYNQVKQRRKKEVSNGKEGEGGP